ncbi:MAG: NUDIX domain-containing protein, partial [Acidimicrobiia bacterium]|nr:NUDIX domain-containing protein [Acidimicrobiia bacterium]
MTAFEEKSRSTRYRGAVISVDEVSLRTPAGDSVSREIVRHMGAVVVVPYDQGHVYLIRQFRAATGGYLLELPAGKRDVAGEPPEVTAVRECVEEVGFEPGRVEKIHEFWNSPGFCDELTLLFVAEKLQARARDPQGAEEQDAEIVRLATDQAFSMVAGGEIVDAKTIIGLYGLERWLRRPAGPGARASGNDESVHVTKGVDHVGLSVLDLTTSRSFFEDCLGWTLIGERSEYPAAYLSDGTAMVTLWQVA